MCSLNVGTQSVTKEMWIHCSATSLWAAYVSQQEMDYANVGTHFDNHKRTANRKCTRLGELQVVGTFQALVA